MRSNTRRTCRSPLQNKNRRLEQQLRRKMGGFAENEKSIGVLCRVDQFDVVNGLKRPRSSPYFRHDPHGCRHRPAPHRIYTLLPKKHNLTEFWDTVPDESGRKQRLAMNRGRLCHSQRPTGRATIVRKKLTSGWTVFLLKVDEISAGPIQTLPKAASSTANENRPTHR